MATETELLHNAGGVLGCVYCLIISTDGSLHPEWAAVLNEHKGRNVSDWKEAQKDGKEDGKT